MKKLIAVSAFLTVAAFAGADEIIAENDVSFQSFDTNLDGVISLLEGSSNEELLASFTKLDIDEDGLLSEDEFAGFSGALN